MKKIAITQRLIDHTGDDEVREALDINYCKFMYECGFLPIALPYEVNFKSYFKELNIEGVLLTGGNDLNVCNPNELSNKRDEFEKQLISYCIEHSIPVFGICRGLQIIAHYFNSSFMDVENQIGTQHQLSVNPKSQYYGDLIKLDNVNSYHNYGIKELVSSLLCSASTKDGIIKAIEHRQYKIFAQMWHPEREKPFNQIQLNVIKNFFG
ncbi:gamma-glutamyl-gamma-aminobutyrate hydrolase family protein [Candidatus Marinarcus aquaticus]|uniref:Gamma-glutamyl-gamma-aminobutyrate hydrolase n=1 Tax=Candidatus Marinarcus aquaticus TaxID=2044504 RepID=A0A4V1LNR9_9BACT|nr:gamma-glutamyl-gamma-aminobutyrate hydrolase family protein [Candidatus Marinarcus aquaticus]RXJ55377.1 gamma-glutamyl-gamma-aminobutyrate hydrolase [Candidatus Marinarcus aquaticus]